MISTSQTADLSEIWPDSKIRDEGDQCRVKVGCYLYSECLVQENLGLPLWARYERGRGL